mgnify:CR=1 FL=1
MKRAVKKAADSQPNAFRNVFIYHKKSQKNRGKRYPTPLVPYHSNDHDHNGKAKNTTRHLKRMPLGALEISSYKKMETHAKQENPEQKNRM